MQEPLKRTTQLTGTASLGTFFYFLWQGPLAKVIAGIVIPFVLLPLMLLMEATSAYFAWRKAQLDKYRDSSLVMNAAVQTFTTLVVATGVFLSILVASGAITLSALVVPALLSAALFFRASYNLVQAFTALARSDFKSAGKHLASFVVAALTGAAIVLGMMMGMQVWALLGVIAGGLAFAAAVSATIMAVRSYLNRSRLDGLEDSSDDDRFEVRKKAPEPLDDSLTLHKSKPVKPWKRALRLAEAAVMVLFFCAALGALGSSVFIQPILLVAFSLIEALKVQFAREKAEGEIDPDTQLALHAQLLVSLATIPLVVFSIMTVFGFAPPALIIPILFTGILAFKAGYSLVRSFANWMSDREGALSNLGIFAATGLAAVGAGLALIGGLNVGALLGIAGGVIAGTIALAGACGAGFASLKNPNLSFGRVMEDDDDNAPIGVAPKAVEKRWDSEPEETETVTPEPSLSKHMIPEAEWDPDKNDWDQLEDLQDATELLKSTAVPITPEPPKQHWLGRVSGCLSCVFGQSGRAQPDPTPAPPRAAAVTTQTDSRPSRF